MADWKTKWLREIGYLVRARPSEIKGAEEHVVDVEVYATFERDLLTVVQAPDSSEPFCFQRGGGYASPDPVASIDEAERFLDGSVKWDGCSNMSFDAIKNGVNLHFCSRADAKAIGELLAACYDLAAEWMPQYEEDLR